MPLTTPLRPRPAVLALLGALVCAWLLWPREEVSTPEPAPEPRPAGPARPGSPPVVPTAPAAPEPLEPVPEEPEARLLLVRGSVRWPPPADFYMVRVTFTCRTSPDAGAVRYTAQVMPDGTYAEHLPPGTCELGVRAPGSRPVLRTGLLLDAEDGPEVSVPEVVLEPGQTVGGQVVDSQGAPVARAWVLLEGEGFRRLVFTDPDGAFTVDGLTEGRFALTGHSPEHGGARGHATAGTRDTRLVLGWRQVHGRVLTPWGAPAPGAQLLAWTWHEARCGHEQTPVAPSPGNASDCPPLPLAGLAPSTDARGRFEARVPLDASLLVQATWEQRSATAEHPPGAPGDLVLTTSEPARVRMRRGAGSFSACEREGPACEVALTVEDARLESLVPRRLLALPPGDWVDLEVRTDVPLALEVPPGLDVELRDGLPPNLRPRRAEERPAPRP